MRVYFQGMKGDAVFRADEIEEGDTGLHLFLGEADQRAKVAYVPFNRLYFVGPDKSDRETVVLSD